MKMKNNKLGHLAPKEYREKYFSSIVIEGDLHHCISHNFLYNNRIEGEKLYNGKPCYYTDVRYINSFNNFYKETYLYNRGKRISLKSCMRRVQKCGNIPIDTIVLFGNSFHYPNKDIDPSYLFKVKKFKKFNPEYEINDPRYFSNFTNCEFSKELTNRLRENGFIVMVDTVIAREFVDLKIDGEVAVAYGHGKKIGFSSFNNKLYGYSDGENNILWDGFSEWSGYEKIEKTTSIDEIINILKK